MHSLERLDERIVEKGNIVENVQNGVVLSKDNGKLYIRHLNAIYVVKEYKGIPYIYTTLNHFMTSKELEKIRKSKETNE